MKKFYAITNLFITVFLIAWNYISNAVGINGNTISKLSAEYFNLFTPAGYAFSIWGLIFLSLLAHSIFQVKSVFDDKMPDDFVLQIGPWLIIANLANGAWLWFWLSEYTGFSVCIMLTILTALLTIVVRLNMERWDASKNIKRWVWIPISLYSGWIAVATIANISAYLAKIEWQVVFSETVWTVIMIVIAALVNLWMLKFRNMRVFSGVGVWAITAIAVRHWSNIPTLQWTALACVVMLVVANILHHYTYPNAIVE
ncbi:MAG: hypothetical protein R3E32_26715 [Chitinophagales bacterium]